MKILLMSVKAGYGHHSTANAIIEKFTQNGHECEMLDIFDYISNNVLMPFLAICTCIMIGWVVKPRLLIGEIRMNGYEFHRKKLYIIMLRYVVPVLLTILLVSSTGIF